MTRQNSRILISFIVVAAVLLLFIPRSGKLSYDYSKGKVWKYETLFAPFDFPIIKTDDQIREELSNASVKITPYYRFQEDVAAANLKAAASLDLDQLGKAYLNELTRIYDKGITSDEEIKKQSGKAFSDVLYIQRGKRAIKCPSNEVFKLSSARAALLSDLERRFPGVNVDSILREKSAYDLIRPNLVYDKQTTQLVNTDMDATVSPTSGYVNAGQLIVSNGEIVTAEIAQMLDSYKKEYEATVTYSRPGILLWFGNAVIIGAILAILFFVIYFIKPKIFHDNRLFYVLLIFLLFSLIPLIVAKGREDILYMMPYTLAALYLYAFFRPRLIVPIYMTTLLPLLVFTNNGVLLYVMFLVSGLVSIYSFKFFGQGWKQFIVAAINFAVLALVYLAFHLIDLATANVLRILFYLLVASLLTVAFYPLIYLFEKIFNLVSNSRLMELCDTSNPLIRELEKKAPGTFQHSLQVMNMADAVARVIDANPLLVRTGALYHDLGKMNNPMCFVENESLMAGDGANRYHSGLSPEQSAHDIIRHVTEGYEMARRKGLPDKVSEFIITHHGTSVTTYFYNKYLNEGGDPGNIAAFSYPGRKPESMEQVILMLCDSIEAASRTLKEYTPEAYSKFVEDMVDSKMQAGQLDNAEISIRDLGLVKEELKKYLSQMHHERIEYPKRQKLQ